MCRAFQTVPTPSLVQIQLVQGDGKAESPTLTCLPPMLQPWTTFSRHALRSICCMALHGTRGLLKEIFRLEVIKGCRQLELTGSCWADRTRHAACHPGCPDSRKWFGTASFCGFQPAALRWTWWRGRRFRTCDSWKIFRAISLLLFERKRETILLGLRKFDR